MEHDLEFFHHLSWERCGRWYRGNTQEGDVEACKSRKSTRDKCQWVLHFGETALPKHKHWVHSKEDIAELTSFLDTKWSNLKPVPGTHQVHCVKSHGSDSVQVSDATDGGEARVCVICTTTTTQEEQGEQDKQEDEDEEEEEQEDEDEEEDEQEDEDKEEDEQEDEDEEEDEQEDEDEEEEDEQEEEEETDIQVGQWVVVLYDGIEYPGEVRSIDFKWM